jgi:hypothetical protein
MVRGCSSSGSFRNHLLIYVLPGLALRLARQLYLALEFAAKIRSIDAVVVKILVFPAKIRTPLKFAFINHHLTYFKVR